MKTRNFFLDTEFEEAYGPDIMPISLALVDEDGKELYIEFEHDKERANKNVFVRDNVLVHLNDQEQCTRAQAVERISTFLGLDESNPEPFRIWAYYADYDWVLFCKLFGTMIDLPESCPKFCMDLQQWWVQLGSPENVKPPQSAQAHDALYDAQWNRVFYNNLVNRIPEAGVPMKLDDLEELNSLIHILANNFRNIEKLQGVECLQLQASGRHEDAVLAGHPDTMVEILAVLQRANERELKRIGELLGHPVTREEVLAYDAEVHPTWDSEKPQ